MGIIRLQNMTFYAHHGLTAQERELGQVFQVDVEISLDMQPAAAADDLSQTVDYGEIYALVEEVVVGREFSLLETLAQTILSGLVDRYELDRVLVRVRKPHPPIPGKMDGVEVELSTD